MILDRFDRFDGAHAYVASGNSTDVIDLGKFTNVDSTSQTGQLGDGNPMAVVVDVDVAPYAGSGDETYSLALVTDSAATLVSSPVTLATLTIDKATAVNTRLVLPVPPNAACKQYLGTILTVGGTLPTITLTSYLQPVAMIDKYKSYLDNSAIK